jgi:hypothetical protein
MGLNTNDTGTWLPSIPSAMVSYDDGTFMLKSLPLNASLYLYER